MCVLLLGVHVARLFTHGWVAPAGLALLPPACGLDEQVASSRLVAHPVVLSLLQAALVCVATSATIAASKQHGLARVRSATGVQLQQRGRSRGIGGGV